VLACPADEFAMITHLTTVEKDWREIAPKKRTTVPGKDHKIYPYLLRGLEVSDAPPA